MTNFRRDLNNQECCNSWQHGIRTINGQYPNDNREFGIVEGAGILITPTTAGIKITNATDPGALEAGQNIVLTPSGDKLIIGTTDDIRVNGDLNVDGDIFQQGASYETHMEQVYTTDDYITMRDGAVTGLSSGQYAGFQVKKYDGTNDGRLVIDNTGTARVGDAGDEQPLLTREESADLSNGDSLVWDSTNQKAITQAIPSAISTALAGKEDSIGSMTVEVIPLSSPFTQGNVKLYRWGHVRIYEIWDVKSTSGAYVQIPTGTLAADEFPGNQTASAIACDINSPTTGSILFFNNNQMYIYIPDTNGSYFGRFVWLV